MTGFDSSKAFAKAGLSEPSAAEGLDLRAVFQVLVVTFSVCFQYICANQAQPSL